MLGSISLRRRDRNALLQLYRRTSDPQLRLRAHILLLLDQGQSWTVIATVLFTSTSTINRWRQRFLGAGLQAVVGPRPPRASAWAAWWVALVIQWVTLRCPSDFGFVRSRWSCDTVVLLLREDHGVCVSCETIRRWLHQANLVWRRPRPVLGPQDPQWPQKLRKIRALLRHLPADETAVFQDEADVNTNPEIGCMWMVRGQQAEVVTPGTNVKRYLAGSLHWRSGELLLSQPGRRRDADLFLAHLDELRRRFRRYKVIHVICDNAVFHVPERCRKVRDYLKRWGHRIRLHFLPTYAPQANPIERVWWHLREEITRNHRCKDIDELLGLIFGIFSGSVFSCNESGHLRGAQLQ
jgi:transposase